MASLAERTGRTVVWLDPTLRVLGSLDRLAAAARGGLALVPLHNRPEPLAGLATRGPFESGLVASDNCSLLRWWAELTVEDALRVGAAFDPLAGHALSTVAGASERVRILRDRGLCAGWWTLAAGGRLAGEPLQLDDEPLTAFNLAGFDPARPHWLSGEDTEGRVRVSDNPALAQLLDAHANELIEAGWQTNQGPWRYRELSGGVAIDDDLRDLYAVARRMGVDLGDPFTEAGLSDLLAWADSESPIGGGVTWYLERVHRRRPDLQLAYPDLVGGDARRLVDWMEEHGAQEEPMLAVLLGRRSARTSVSAGPATATPGKSGDVRLVGYLEDGLGLGEAARSYVRALTTAGVDVESVSVPVPMPPGNRDRVIRRRRVVWEATDDRRAGEPAIEIVCMNPPELLRAHQAGMTRSRRTHRVGVWAWELDTMPRDWAEAVPLVDEIWVYSDYVASAVRRVTDLPVNVAPLAIDMPPVEARGGADRPFTFLFVFDLLSSVERKNPLGLIEAFTLAFEAGEGPRLVVKTSNGDNEPEQLERIRVAAAGRPDIDVVDEFIPKEERDALIAGCDCYVSLHRAEGFGLTLAEAMAAARPVIATDYSGNLDFMSEETAYLVGWSPARVGEGSVLYPADARWAEPDLAQAAALMRSVYGDPASARARGQAAREHVARTLSAAVVGAALRERIDHIPRRGSHRPRIFRSRRLRRDP